MSCRERFAIGVGIKTAHRHREMHCHVCLSFKRLNISMSDMSECLSFYFFLQVFYKQFQRGIEYSSSIALLKLLLLLILVNDNLEIDKAV